MISILEVEKIINKSINDKNEEEQKRLSEIIYNFCSSREGIRKKIRKHDSTLKELIIEMRKGFEMMEKRFEMMEKRFEMMEKRFEAIDKRFDDLIHQIDKRFEAVDKRFDDLIRQMDKRFEAVDKRFEDMNKRFDDMNRTFKLFLWLIGIGITFTNIMIGILIALKAFN